MPFSTDSFVSLDNPNIVPNIVLCYNILYV
uniref:Uncharacterized protein n=1 Tax=virus sp. ctmTa7 TaxID=2828255 RepID=A0A8S5RCX5_9VIRU|nr:MAG TPA: hypothetical protein [virus sp. ctmTa7]